MTRLVLAIDPGLYGALALVDMDAPEYVVVHDMPTVRQEVDAAGVARVIRATAPDIVVIERVASRPGQGVASMFKFGTGYGMVRGVVATLGLEMHLVTPNVWKKHYRLTADKEAARERAIQFWPGCDGFSLKKHAGRAEAALLARYGAETFMHSRSAARETGRGVAGAGGGSAVVGTDATTSSPRAPGVPA